MQVKKRPNGIKCLLSGKQPCSSMHHHDFTSSLGHHHHSHVFQLRYLHLPHQHPHLHEGGAALRHQTGKPTDEEQQRRLTTMKEVGGRDAAQLVERQTSELLRQFQFPGAARDFSPRVNFRVSLSYGVCTAPACSALTSVHMLKIPSLGSHTFAWTHKNIAHNVGNRKCCSCGCCILTQVRRLKFSARDK